MRLGRQGFTLIELIITLCTIGILAALAIPAFIGYVGRARLSQVVSEGGLLLADEAFMARNVDGSACEVTRDTALKVKTDMYSRTIGLEIIDLAVAKDASGSNECCREGLEVVVPQYVAARMAGYTLKSDKTVLRELRTQHR